MSNQDSQPTLKEPVAIFACEGVSYMEKDVIDAALFRGDLAPIWNELLRSIECENQADELEIEEGALDQAAEEFRYDHDLITAEETEHWLEARDLTLDDFGEYFARRYWGEHWNDEVAPKAIDYVAAPEDLRDLLKIDLILSGEFDKMARELSWRVAAAFESKAEEIDPASIALQEKSFLERTGIDQAGLVAWLSGIGRNREWLDEMLRMEAILHAKRDQLLNPKSRQSELAALRLPLTRFEVEMVEVESMDAAREASLCVTEDEMSMEEVAKEGRYPFTRVELLLQEIDNELQQKFLSVSPGKVLEPLTRGDGFQLCRIMKKIAPDADDPALQARIDQSILDRHFCQLVADRIQWRGPLNYAQ